MAALLAVSCGEEEAAQPSLPDVDETPATLAEQLDQIGLPAGSWNVDESIGPVCVKTYTYPGGGRSTRAFDLSGFGTFELRLEDDAISFRGSYDEVSVRLVNAVCLEYDADEDTLTHLNDCDERIEDTCTPFSLLRLCADAGDPESRTLQAAIPECGQNTFGASPVQTGE